MTKTTATGLERKAVYGKRIAWGLLVGSNPAAEWKQRTCCPVHCNDPSKGCTPIADGAGLVHRVCRQQGRVGAGVTVLTEVVPLHRRLAHAYNA
jgi:hypothetical protein